MGTVYDASYRSGVGSSRADRDVGDGNRRAAFIHQQPDTPLYEVSQLSNSDEDDDVSCDLEPAEYSPTMMPTGGTSMFSNVGYGAATLAKSVAQAGKRHPVVSYCSHHVISIYRAGNQLNIPMINRQAFSIFVCSYCRRSSFLPATSVYSDGGRTHSSALALFPRGIRHADFIYFVDN